MMMSQPQRVVVVSGASSDRSRHRRASGTGLRRRSRDRPPRTRPARIAEQIEQGGARSLVLPLDLRDPETPARAITATIAEFGRLDGIAAIAGAVKQADLFALSDTDWDDALSVKLHSMRRLLLAGWPT